jgi:hypothetical protein
MSGKRKTAYNFGCGPFGELKCLLIYIRFPCPGGRQQAQQAPALLQQQDKGRT